VPERVKVLGQIVAKVAAETAGVDQARHARIGSLFLVLVLVLELDRSKP
jgi:hypothetical protein